MSVGSFYITRPHVKKPGFWTGEWLRGSVRRDEAREEAVALLTDPRDTIDAVYFWSDRHNQYDGFWTRRSIA